MFKFHAINGLMMRTIFSLQRINGSAYLIKNTEYPENVRSLHLGLGEEDMAVDAGIVLAELHLGLALSVQSLHPLTLPNPARRRIQSPPPKPASQESNQPSSGMPILDQRIDRSLMLDCFHTFSHAATSFDMRRSLLMKKPWSSKASKLKM